MTTCFKSLPEQAVSTRWPCLKTLFVDTNTVGLKSTGRNVLCIRGSRGDSNLKSIPVSELIVDEMDEMDIHAVWLALERLWFGHFPEDGWDYLGDLMREWQVLAALVDAHANINDVRRFAKRFHGYVWLTRYRRGQTAKEIAMQEEEIIKQLRVN